MYETERAWRDVDDYFIETLSPDDDALAAARESGNRTTMPKAEVAPNQGRFLAILAGMLGARRVLEFGTLAGYSTIHLARAVGDRGHVTTLELEETNAGIARENLTRAHVADRVQIIVGPATDTAAQLTASGVEPYDLVFIDADKPNNPAYLQAALLLTQPGAVIVIDNVVRNGAVTEAESQDDRVQGVRAVLNQIATDPRLEATALQTVGLKGWDGFTIVRRVD